MYISGLMDSKTDFRYGDQGSFPGKESLEFALQLLRALMKKQWVGNRRKRFYSEIRRKAV